MLPSLELSLLGLPRYEITGWESHRGHKEVHFFCSYREPPQECPRCQGTCHRIKDRFERVVRHENSGTRRVYLHLRVRKLRCQACGRTFHERFPGLLPRRRYTEPFRRQIVGAHRGGISQKTLGDQEDLGHATIERWAHELLEVKSRELELAYCPRILGIDEHHFLHGRYSTTLCNLERHRIFDMVPGRSREALKDYLGLLPGRLNVRLVCMDLSNTYRAVVHEFFPRAQIVADRFHVIRLVIRAFRDTWMAVDPKGLTDQGLRSLLKYHPQNLKPEQWAKLAAYLRTHDVVRWLYEFKNGLCRLLSIKHRTKRQGRPLVHRLLEATRQLRESKFAFLVTLGNTLENWQQEIARMWRYTRNNGITEGFHTKIEMIQRRAYGFRNFENLRLRVRVLCGG
jgi:transposase